MDTEKYMNTKEYETFVDNVNSVDYFKYIKENPGVTLKNISEHFEQNEIFVEIILEIWTRNWNTFFSKNEGRVIKDTDMYYCLSPRNPNIRTKNPSILFTYCSIKNHK